jgi:hypothetical protein
MLIFALLVVWIVRTQKLLLFSRSQLKRHRPPCIFILIMWRNLFVGNILDVFTTVRSNNAVRMEIRNYSTRKNQIKIPAVFMRGGTSKCLMFQEKDLPKDKALWDKIFLSAMGSPDPNERQMGTNLKFLILSFILT